MAVLRCTLKLRDGRVHVGYTPAFDPADGSLWLTATPDSPAGTMFTLERARVLVLEPLGGRPVAMPASTSFGGAAVSVRVTFSDGEVLVARRSAEAPGIGVWLEPPARGRARAFVPTEAAERIEEVADEADSFEAIQSWAFLPAEPTMPPSLSSLTMPVSPASRVGGSLSMPPPSRLMPSASSSSAGSDATPTDAIPAVSASDLDALHTQPVALPLVPPPVPPTSRTWPDGGLSESTSSITTPDLARPELDE